MKINFYIFILIFFASIFIIKAQIPTQNLKLWLMADSGVVHNAGAVEIWQDISGNGNHALQTTSYRQPILKVNTIGGKPALAFDGINDFMLSDINVTGSNLTSYLILKALPSFSSAGALSIFNNATTHDYDNPNSIVIAHIEGSNITAFRNWNSFFYQPTNNTFNLFRLEANGSVIRTRANSGSVFTGTSTGVFNSNRATIGGRYSSNSFNFFMNMEISEIIIYDSLLTATEMLQVENYLMDKYSPPVSLGPDININYVFCPIELKVGNNFTNILWSTGETSTSISVNQSGTYSVSAVDIFGRISTDSINIQFPHFAFADTIICIGDTVNFTSQLQSVNYNYLWSDSSTGFSLNISEAGTYWLRLTDSLACFRTDSFVVVLDTFALLASLGPDISVCSGAEIALVSGNQNIVSYLWSNSATTPSIPIYTSGPNSLTVTNTNMCVATDSIFVNIHGHQPNTGFTATNFCFGETTIFTDTSTAIFPDSINFRKWIIENDTFYVSNLQYQFNSPGVFNISLTVTTDSGCVANINSPIIINELAQVNFNLPEYAWTNDSIFLSNQSISTDSIISTNWTVSDSNSNVINSSTLANPSFLFNAAGTYSIKLEIETIKNCYSSLSKNIKIEDKSIPFNNLKLWLRADRGIEHNQNFVSNWKDQSLNNNHALQTTSNRQPLLKVNAIGGKPAVTFDGINDFMLSDVSLSGNNLTSYLILKVLPSITSAGALSIFNNATTHDYDNPNSIVIAHIEGSNITAFRNWNSFFYQPTNNTFNLFRLEANGSVIRTRANSGSVITGTSTGVFNSNRATIGSRYSSNSFNVFMNMEISEIIIYDSLLTASEMLQVENYLMDKYSPPVSLGADINIVYGFCPIELKVGNNFTNILWSTGATSTSISVTQSGTYSVSAVDIFGRFSIDSINIQFPHFTFADTVICMGDTVNFTSQLQSVNYNYLWSDSSTAFSLNISEAGTYWMKLTDSLGCFRTDSFVVVLDTFALLPSLGPDITACSGESLALTSGASQTVEYLWSTSATTSSIVLQTSGEYSVTVSNAIGCSVADTILVTVSGYKPIVGFMADSVCFGLPTSFTDTSTAASPDEILTWIWTIDGNTFNQQHPKYEFSQSGNHIVQLYVETDSGCVAAVSRNVFVLPNPKAAFQPFTGCSGKPIQFNNLSTLGFGNISGYKWWAVDSNDLIIDSSTNTHPLFTFAQVGNYEVWLSAVSENGCIDTIYREVEVKRTPATDFTWSNTCIGQPTSFIETTQVAAHEVIILRSWNFGDGIVSNLPNPLHNFDNTGNYNVSLYNKSVNGCENTVIKPVTIHSLPIAGFEYSLPCLNKAVLFTDTSSVLGSSIEQIIWTFPNGDTTSLWQPSYVFPDTGNFTVSVMAISAEGCKKTATRNITVYPFPDASFSFSPEYGSQPLEVSFTNSSIGAISYVWDFGDSRFSTQTNPSHTYTSSNVYTVTLEAVNTFLCTDTAYGTVYVIPSTYDIAVIDVQMTTNNNMRESSVHIRNLGTRIIRSLKMKLQVDSDMPITEIWEGILHPGEDTWFTFNALLEEDLLTSRKLLCLSAFPNEVVEDINLANNTWCNVLAPGFYILNISPNPATDEIFVTFILKETGKVNIAIIASDGRKVIEQTDFSGHSGMNKIKVDISTLQQGVYVVSIYNETDNTTGKLLIGK